MVTLYHYSHCPFCVRVRLALGAIGQDYESVLLDYDDEKTPTELAGAKMLPILKLEDGSYMNESLDIIEEIDQNHLLKFKDFKDSRLYSELHSLLDQINPLIHSLAMPYWVHSFEFNDRSKAYFHDKKSQKRGDFVALQRRRDEFMQELIPMLAQLESDLLPFYHSKEFSIMDVILASHLWGLYTVVEFQFSEKLHTYLQEVKRICHFDYYSDYKVL